MEQQFLSGIIVCYYISDIQKLYTIIGQIPDLKIHSTVAVGNTIEYQFTSKRIEAIEALHAALRED